MKKLLLICSLIILSFCNSFCDEGWDFDFMKDSPYKIFTFPKIGMINSFKTKYIPYLSLGLFIKTLSDSKYNYDLFHIELPLNSKIQPYADLINYDLFQLNIEDLFVPHYLSEEKNRIINLNKFSFNILHRQRDYYNEIAELNYFSVSDLLAHSFLLDHNFTDLNFGIGAQLALTKLEMGKFNNHIFNGLDWKLFCDASFETKYGGISFKPSIRYLGYLYIFSYETLLKITYNRVINYNTTIDYADATLQPLISIYIIFNRSLYRFNGNDNYINSLKLNLDVYLHYLLNS
jgi:hypothetical protein